ncbi:MAG: hypothetical protein RLO81_14425, partial [Fulvivirga sp.]|uniref:hypothetical protein n=1 Tax=Fulvivirga sp. TaxID=1931237 RepID=UPI0032EAD249
MRVKIVDNKIKVSDSEIESFKDFDSVLDRTRASSIQNTILSKMNRRLIALFAAVATAVIIGYFMSNDNTLP